MDDPPSNIVLLLILLLLSALFSATETAFTSLSFYQLRDLKTRGRRGRIVYHLSKKPDILLTTILAGNNLVNIAASAIATTLAISLWGSHTIGYATGVLTLVVLLFAEITPKQIAIVKSQEIALFMAPIIQVLSWISYPIIKGIGWISQILSRLIIGKNNQQSISLEGLAHFMGEAKDQGVLDENESSIIHGALRFNSTQVRGIMTHRTNVFSISDTETLDSAYPKIIESKYSRIPVYHGDKEEHIVGILLLHTLLESMTKQENTQVVEHILEKPLFIPENTSLQEAFSMFQQERMNMAIVLDEFGGLAGVVTIEDIIEEFFGEIYDEHEQLRSARIIPNESGTFTVAGDITVGEFSDYFSISLDTDKHINTLGGVLLEKFDHIPTRGEQTELPWGTCEIKEVKENRITSFTFTPSIEQD